MMATLSRNTCRWSPRWCAYRLSYAFKIQSDKDPSGIYRWCAVTFCANGVAQN